MTLDLKSLLPLLLKNGGLNGSQAFMSGNTSPFGNGGVDALDPQLKSLLGSNPSLAPLLQMMSAQSARAHGLTPIKFLANNEILGMLSKFFS